MALLSGTSPKCDNPVFPMRFRPRRRWDWFGLRAPVVSSIEETFDDAVDEFTEWKRRPADHGIATFDAQHLVLSIAHGTDPDVIRANFLALLDVDGVALWYLIRSLVDQVSRERKLAETQWEDINDKLAVQIGLVDGLRRELERAQNLMAGLISSGCRSLAVITADGVKADRGDSVFLGTEPERRLILIDSTEALCAESRKVIGLPDGVPVFSKRDRARAWKRSQRTPLSSPCQSGTAQGDAMPTASVGGTTGGASSLGRDGTELFPEAC